MVETAKRIGVHPADAGSAGTEAPIEKSAVEARQGFRGKHVLYVLCASLALAVLAYLVLHIYFLGGIL